MQWGPSESAATTMIHCKNHGKQKVKNQIVEKNGSDWMYIFRIIAKSIHKILCAILRGGGDFINKKQYGGAGRKKGGDVAAEGEWALEADN